MRVRYCALVFLKGLAAFLVAASFWEVIDRNFVFATTISGYRPNFGHFPASGRAVNSEEGYSSTWYDAEGFREGRPIPAPANRILILGDSYTNAMQVATADNYCSVLQRMFGASGKDVWVINGGVSGSSPARYVNDAPWYLSNLHPQQVVVQLDQLHFVMDLPVQHGDFFLRPTRNGFVIRSEEERHQVQDQLKHFGLGRFILDQSLVRTAMLRLGFRDEQLTFASEKQLSVQGVDYAPYVDWVVHNLKKAFGNPLIVYIPTIDYFNLEKPPHNVESELAAECAHEGLSFINMRQSFLQSFACNKAPCHGFVNTAPGVGHINAIGHALVAKEIYKALVRRGTVR
ncbi:MAG TPA: hypothetical protein VG944_03645 [Fimbriimonas sp.]|nr:hypothetical protein [Fimbriimonas sp.]